MASVVSPRQEYAGREPGGDLAAATIELTRQPAIWHTLSMAGNETKLKIIP
jgi:hypothetical protein